MKIEKLCRKDIEKNCIYCECSTVSTDEEIIICKHKGFVKLGDSCKKFKYNPLKRHPPKRVQIRRNFSFASLEDE